MSGRVAVARPAVARSLRASALLASALALALFGCVPLPPLATIPGRPVAPDTTHHPPATPRPVPRPATRAAVVDSLPSAEALNVLSTIPEPLSPAERVPAPDVAPPVSAPAPAMTDDSGTGATDRDRDEIPVPTPTRVLGDRVNPRLLPGADSASVAAPAPAVAAPSTPASPPASPPAKSPAPAASTACWRVQVAAPKEKAEAESKRSAAESLLLVPMVIERERDLWKIRTRDCYERATADQVRSRAIASGFVGAFPFEGAPRR